MNTWITAYYLPNITVDPAVRCSVPHISWLTVEARIPNNRLGGLPPVVHRQME